MSVEDSLHQPPNHLFERHRTNGEPFGMRKAIGKWTPNRFCYGRFPIFISRELQCCWLDPKIAGQHISFPEHALGEIGVAPSQTQTGYIVQSPREVRIHNTNETTCHPKPQASSHTKYPLDSLGDVKLLCSCSPAG